MRFAIPLVIFLGLAVMLGLGLQRDPRALESALLDQPLPVFDLPVLQSSGQNVDTQPVRWSPQSLQGQVWLLNVWASWCAPCRQEIPVLAQMSQQDKVSVYGLNYKDDVAKALSLLRVAGNPYVASGVDADGRVGMDLGIHAVPETFVIDAQGRVRFRHLGPVTREVWRDTLMPVVRAVQ